MSGSLHEWMDPLGLPDVDEPARLLAQCMYAGGDAERPHRVLQQYREDRELHLAGLGEGGRLIGIAGYRAPSHRDAVLLHLAVSPELRGGGAGRRLVSRCLQAARNGVLRAETDADAVGFYRKLGFDIRSLGEKYPGVERFDCTLRRYVPRKADSGDFSVVSAWPASRSEAFYMFPKGGYPLRADELEAAAAEDIHPTLLTEAADGTPAAYANLYESEGKLWLGNVIVSPDYRGKGAAAALLEAMEAAAAERVRELHLTCHGPNGKALLFFAGAGWMPWDIRRMEGPDGTPIAAVRMRKLLTHH